ARWGREPQTFLAAKPAALDPALAAIARAAPDGLLVEPHPMFWIERAHIARQAANHKIPAIYESRDFVAAGGLMAYGASLADMSRRAGRDAGPVPDGAQTPPPPHQAPPPRHA